jgi:hypothetical protein
MDCFSIIMIYLLTATYQAITMTSTGTPTRRLMTQSLTRLHRLPTHHHPGTTTRTTTTFPRPQVARPLI